jgi:alkylated DNA nucleotide flippase Atl1
VASAFAEAVWAMVRQVPAGQATTYGDLAEAYFGVRRGSRSVGRAMAGCPGDVPWWRVVYSDGRAKPEPGGAEQRARLAEEGVPLTADGRVDWAGLDGPWLPP